MPPVSEDGDLERAPLKGDVRLSSEGTNEDGSEHDHDGKHGHKRVLGVPPSILAGSLYCLASMSMVSEGTSRTTTNPHRFLLALAIHVCTRAEARAAASLLPAVLPT